MNGLMGRGEAGQKPKVSDGLAVAGVTVVAAVAAMREVVDVLQQ